MLKNHNLTLSLPTERIMELVLPFIILTLSLTKFPQSPGDPVNEAGLRAVPNSTSRFHVLKFHAQPPTFLGPRVKLPGRRQRRL